MGIEVIDSRSIKVYCANNATVLYSKNNKTSSGAKSVDSTMLFAEGLRMTM